MVGLFDYHIIESIIPEAKFGDVLKNYTSPDEVICNHDSIIFKKIAMYMAFGNYEEILQTSKLICETLSFIDENNQELIYYKPDMNKLMDFVS